MAMNENEGLMKEGRHSQDVGIKDDKTIMILPPVISRTAATAGGVVNRALFVKKIDLAAATVANNSHISRLRDALLRGRELLKTDRLSPVVAQPDKSLADQGKKCLLLIPGTKADVPDTWGPVLKEAVQRKEVGVIPYQLSLDYNHWSYHEVMTCILPEELQGDIPTGFNVAGHVAHLNLRQRFDPHKKLVAEVLLDKNSHIRTVINKTDTVGSESEFRTFQYEVLAGEDDMQVQLMESGCFFNFDYSKVYWNSKLEPEHRRIVDLVKPGEVLCDVMAGIGPFAVPAGKKGVFVWANDMNPESYECLQVAIRRNKVGQYVRAFCQDGRTFIHWAADSVLEASRAGAYAKKAAKQVARGSQMPAVLPEPVKIPLPLTVAHFIMNLPASAMTFVHHFRGLYAGHERLFSDEDDDDDDDDDDHGKEPTRKLPMVHVHCFGLKANDAADDAALRDVCAQVSAELGVTMRLAGRGGHVTGGCGDPAAVADGEVAVHYVRDVAPAKRMLCASFRLPREVAFAPRERSGERRRRESGRSDVE